MKNVRSSLDCLKLKDVLDQLYRSYNFSERVLHDPIEFPHRYSNRDDIEIAGFIASAFAYGKVTLFKPVIEKILGLMGDHPGDFTANFDITREAYLFEGIKYRFNDTGDIVSLIHVLSLILKEHGSIEGCFLGYYHSGGISSAINGFVDSAMHIYNTPGNGGRGIYNTMTHRGFKHFLPSPSGGSPCKRINLFLRWMVRDRDIDFGVWQGIKKNHLVIPLDTHIARISRCLELTSRKSRDWKMAEEITESLKKLDPDDPLKYDFALCHQGIMGVCREGACGKDHSSCPILHGRPAGNG